MGYTILAILLAVAIFLVCGRLIGWALGISILEKKLSIAIRQNTEQVEALESLIKIQTAIARKQGIRTTDFEALEREEFLNDPRFRNEVKRSESSDDKSQSVAEWQAFHAPKAGEHPEGKNHNPPDKPKSRHHNKIGW